MNVALFLIIPFGGALLAWLLGHYSRPAARVVSVAAMAATLTLGVVLWALHPDLALVPGAGQWLEVLRLPWIPSIGAEIYLALDGLSLLMVLLASVMGLLAVLVSWRSVAERVGLFHFQLLLTITAVMGVFLALDLLLFYLFWELMLVPTYFLIVIWGEERRRAAGFKFFLFTQSGGLLLIVAILALYFLHGSRTGEYTFDALRLAGSALSGAAALWVMLGFFVAYAVKLPAFPLHSWLPDAYNEAPTAATLLLATLLSKTGAYGLIRFNLLLFPSASSRLAPWAMAMGVAGILYGGIAAFRQRDLKRLVAFTSLSHLGFVLLGIYAANVEALQGAVFLMIAHAVTTGALFILIGLLGRVTGTREMDSLGGLWTRAPRFSGALLVFALAALGLPGMGNFVGEFLVLLGTFRVRVAFAAVAVTGMIVSVVYGLLLVRRAVLGPPRSGLAAPELRSGSLVLMGVLIALILWLGLYPQPILDRARPFLEAISQAYTGGGA